MCESTPHLKIQIGALGPLLTRHSNSFEDGSIPNLEILSSEYKVKYISTLSQGHASAQLTSLVQGDSLWHWVGFGPPTLQLLLKVDCFVAAIAILSQLMLCKPSSGSPFILLLSSLSLHLATDTRPLDKGMKRGRAACKETIERFYLFIHLCFYTKLCTSKMVIKQILLSPPLLNCDVSDEAEVLKLFHIRMTSGITTYLQQQAIQSVLGSWES